MTTKDHTDEVRHFCLNCERVSFLDLRSPNLNCPTCGRPSGLQPVTNPAPLPSPTRRAPRMRTAPI